MIVVFRTDASLEIGSGHVMRSLTLADAMCAQGAECHFISRPHEGHLLDLIQSSGYSVHRLHPIEDKSTTKVPKSANYANWLGVNQTEDARQTIALIRSAGLIRIDWLITDHYGIDAFWHRELRPHCNNIMVIDDLANRKHDCDVLLDQTFGREEEDYHNLAPQHCRILLGTQYALLRSEFAQWREYSLRRRQYPAMKRLLITLGGVDKDNVTGQVLTVLQNCNLPDDCEIVIVMGSKAPWFDVVRSQAAQLVWPAKVLVNVDHMAELMADSDFCIGAAGSTAWERCCLGLPTIMFVLAENQRLIAQNLSKQKIVIVADFVNELPKWFSNDQLNQLLPQLTSNSSNICTGTGSELVSKVLFNAA